MDPLRIVARVAVAFVVLLLFVRLSGKRTVRQGNAFDFTVSLIIGDMIDDMLWAEVNVAEFIVGAGVLWTLHTLIATLGFRLRARG
jgi:uncharacterized membrane protein YcaP (DUF421 family)